MNFITKTSLELRNLWPFYLESLIANIFYIAMPFEALYFLSIGLNLTQIGILIAIWPLASLITEIPTGAIADIYGRKFSVLFGVFLTGLLFLFIPFMPNYIFLLVVYALLGIAQTFMSGSYDAWVVDLLKYRKLNFLVKNFFSRYHILLNISLVSAGILGVFLVGLFGLNIIWFSCAFAHIVAGIILLFAEEKHIRKKFVGIKKSFLETISQTKEALKFSFNHHVLFNLIFASFILAIACNFDEFLTWTPLLKEFSFPDSWFGYIYSAGYIVGALGLLFSSRLSKKLGDKKSLILIALLGLMAGLFVLVASKIYVVVGLFMLTYFLANIVIPIRQDFFHKFIPSKMRATIGSVDSLLNSLGSIIFFAVAGFLVDRIGSRYTIALTSSLMLVVVILYWRIKEK